MKRLTDRYFKLGFDDSSQLPSYTAAYEKLREYENEMEEKDINGTGIIRRVDDLGRIVLPKEVRRKVGISEGTPMEIFTSDEGIVLKKYDSEYVLSDIAQNLMETTEDMCVDLGPKKTEDIRRHIREIQKLLKQGN